MKLFFALIGVLLIAGFAFYLWLGKKQFGEVPGATDKLRFQSGTNFDAASGTFRNPEPEPPLIVNGWALLKIWLFGSEVRAPSEPFPSRTPDIEAFLKKDDVLVKWLWLGHSTFYLNFDGRLILVDPVFSAASPVPFMVTRFLKPLVKLADLPKPDMVLISHDHYDHLDASVMQEMAKDPPEFLVPLGVGSRLKSWGIPAEKVRELNWHESVTFQDIAFTSMPGQHFSGRSFNDRGKTLWTGWLVSHANFKIYYSGDTGYASHFKEIGERYGPIDLAFLECGQYNKSWQYVHMLPDEVIQAAKDVKAQAITPLHWGMFVLALHDWFEPIERVTRMAEAERLPIWHPELGELVRFVGEPSGDAWWRKHPDFIQHALKD